LPARFAKLSLTGGVPGSAGGGGGAFFRPSSEPRWRDVWPAGVAGAPVSAAPDWGEEDGATGAPCEMRGKLGIEKQGRLGNRGWSPLWLLQGGAGLHHPKAGCPKRSTWCLP